MAASEVDFMLVESRALLREAFVLIDEGVEAVMAHRPDLDVIGADVFAATLRGSIELRLIRVAGTPMGFMATFPVRDVTGRSVLHIWLLYIRPGTPDVGAEVAAETDYLAREQGCEGVAFGTTRTGWERRAARYGFVPQQITYYRPVEGGAP